MKTERVMAVILLVLGVAFSLREPRFLQPQSVSSILLWIPLLAVVGLGQMLVIVTRGIDVSIGSVAGFSAMAMGLAFKANPNLGLLPGTLIAVAAGTTLGALNGGLIAFARVPPIIATLGGLSAYRGLTFVLSKGKQVDSNYLPDALTDLSSKGVAVGAVTVPWILLLTAALLLVGAGVMRFSRFGRDLFAIGGNPSAAFLRGIPVSRRLFWAYCLCGALAGWSGVAYASKFGFVNPGSAGKGLELSVIAAVVIGGVKVSGGVGSVLGVLIGCVLVGMLSSSLALLGISEDQQQLAYGFLILLAVTSDVGIQSLNRNWRWKAS